MVMGKGLWAIGYGETQVPWAFSPIAYRLLPIACYFILSRQISKTTTLSGSGQAT